jgi:hypothetical protein
MMRSRGTRSGDKVDAFSRRSRRLLTWKRGELTMIKRAFWKRIRKLGKPGGRIAATPSVIGQDHRRHLGQVGWCPARLSGRGGASRLGSLGRPFLAAVKGPTNLQPGLIYSSEGSVCGHANIQ